MKLGSASRKGLTPATRAGRRVERREPPPGVLTTAVRPAPAEPYTTPAASTNTTSGRVIRTLIGTPLRAFTIVETCHPPRIALPTEPMPDRYLRPFPKGRA